MDPLEANPNRGDHKVNISVDVLLLRGNSVFMLCRKNTGFEDGKYCLPSGHVELHESPIEAAVREAREETGVDIDPVDLKLVHVIHRRNLKTEPRFQEYVDFVFLADRWSGEPVNQEPNKCEHEKWVDLGTIPANVVYYLPQVFDSWKNGQIYSEHLIS